MRFREQRGKNPTPIVADGVERLEGFGGLGAVTGLCTDRSRVELLSMPASAVGQYLKRLRTSGGPRRCRPPNQERCCARKLRASGPAPGLIEIDTVARCGHGFNREFLYSIILNRRVHRMGTGASRTVCMAPALPNAGARLRQWWWAHQHPAYRVSSGKGLRPD